MIKSVSQIWFQFAKILQIKLSVRLQDMGQVDSYYSIYTKDELNYLTFNSSSTVVIQIKDPNTLWDMSKSVHVNDINIVRFNRGLLQLQQRLSNPNLFRYYKRDGGIEYCGTKEDRITIQLGKNEFLELEPGVIFISNDNCIPGVYVRLNKKANEVGISIDEFEAIARKFSRVDIGTEGLHLIIARLQLENRLQHVLPEVPKQKPKASIYEGKNQTRQEYVKDNRVNYQKTTEPKSLFDL